MKKFRIVTNGKKYTIQIQEKFLWWTWWEFYKDYVYRCFCGYDYYIISFSTLEEAKLKMSELDFEHNYANKWKPVEK